MPHELWMKPMDDTLVPATAADIATLRRLAGEMAVKVRINANRSQKHHRFFFAAIADACANWPETHEFQTKSPERLRAWLLCKAGQPYREHLKYKAENEFSAKMMASFIEMILEHLEAKAITVTSGDLVYVLYPKSIAWGKLDQAAFNEISQRVSDVLQAEIGMTLDDFKQEAAA